MEGLLSTGPTPSSFCNDIKFSIIVIFIIFPSRGLVGAPVYCALVYRSIVCVNTFTLFSLRMKTENKLFHNTLSLVEDYANII